MCDEIQDEPQGHLALSGQSLTQKAIYHMLLLLRHSGQRNTRGMGKLLGIAIQGQLGRDGSEDALGSDGHTVFHDCEGRGGKMHLSWSTKLHITDQCCF